MYPDKGETDHSALTESSPFHFDCNESLPCFTQCCRDVNIYLTPYDVLRLRRSLKMGSTEFLEKHTRHFLARSVNIPVVQLIMDPDNNLYCKLVSERGCRVYNDRPWACRMYPLDLAGNSDQYCLISGSERCLGLMEPRTWTVRKWLDGQGLQKYVEMEQKFQTILPPTLASGRKLDVGSGKIVFLAYDLDRFATLLHERAFRKLYDIDDGMLERMQQDDEELLLLCFRYIRNQLENVFQTR